MSSTGTASASPSTSLVSAILSAFQKVLGASATPIEASLKAQATALANGILVVGAQRKTLTGAQAELLLKSFADAAEAGLAADVAALKVDANGLVIAGLKAAIDFGLGSIGLGWLKPVVDDVIDALNKGETGDSGSSG